MGEANRKVAQHIAQIGVFSSRSNGKATQSPLKPQACSPRTLDERIRAKFEGRILACSAVIQTRWTAATIARHIEAAGGGTVLPFAIHRRP